MTDRIKLAILEAENKSLKLRVKKLEEDMQTVMKMFYIKNQKSIKPYNHHKTIDGIVSAQCSICDQIVIYPESYCSCCGYAIDWTGWKTKSEEKI